MPSVTSTVVPASHGTLSGTAPNLTYTPSADYNGPDSFTYTAAGPGGTSAPADVAPEVMAAIKTNSGLLDRLGATSVPYIVARHQRSGQVVMQAGANDTEALANFLGLGQP